MDNPIHITIKNDFAEIAKVHAAVEAFGRHFHIQSDSLYAINLALDELLANTINYAYEGNEAHAIGITLEYTESAVHIAVVDDGNAFNPFDAPPPDLTRELEDRPVGGLGIHLVKNVMSAMDYKRINGKNIVTVSRAL